MSNSLENKQLSEEEPNKKLWAICYSQQRGLAVVKRSLSRVGFISVDRCSPQIPVCCQAGATVAIPGTL